MGPFRVPLLLAQPMATPQEKYFHMLPRWAPGLANNPESPSDGTVFEQDFEQQGGVGCAICLFYAAVPNTFSLFRVTMFRLPIIFEASSEQGPQTCFAKVL